MMQAIGLLYFCFIIITSCLIALIIHLKFSKYPLKLIVIYLIGIVLISIWIGIKYWQLAQLNSNTILKDDQAFMEGSNKTLPSRVINMISRMKALAENGEMDEIYQQLY